MMKRRMFMTAAGVLALGLGSRGAALAQDSVTLPAPAVPGGKTLEEALRNRRSQRDYSDKDLPDDVLSGLLWAAFGVNRPDKGGRTAPSSRNKQEIDIYVTRKDGFFLYEAKTNSLARKGGEDIRAVTGTQGYVGKAPVNLVFVADMKRGSGSDEQEKLLSAWADTGFISQNVYLYCAVSGLATVVRASLDQAALAKALGLAATQRIILAQSVGYPKS